VAGGIAGAVVFAALAGLGSLLSSRVGNPIPVIVLAVPEQPASINAGDGEDDDRDRIADAGIYGGWLLGVIVFGAIRGGNEGERG